MTTFLIVKLFCQTIFLINLDKVSEINQKVKKSRIISKSVYYINNNNSK